MRLVEFLILLLETHAQALQRLAALLGEERLFELLEEQTPPPPDEARTRPRLFQMPEWMEDARAPKADGAQAYAEIEGAVRDLALAEILEFHLWAYPYYRAFIESGLDLNSRIRGAGSDAGILMVEEAMEEAKRWVQKLPMPPGISTQAERAAEIPWLRFRALALKRVGKRPLGPVY